jgi:acyl carrier protein
MVHPISSRRQQGNKLAIIDDVRLAIAKSLKVPTEQVSPDARLDQLGVESLDVIEIVYELEEKYNITIPFSADEGARISKGSTAEDNVPFSTVADIAALVQKLLDARAAR